MSFSLLLFIRYSIYSIITTGYCELVRHLIFCLEVLKVSRIYRYNSECVTCCLISFTFFIEANGNTYEKSVSLKMNVHFFPSYNSLLDEKKTFHRLFSFIRIQSLYFFQQQRHIILLFFFFNFKSTNYNMKVHWSSNGQRLVYKK